MVGEHSGERASRDERIDGTESSGGDLTLDVGGHQFVESGNGPMKEEVREFVALEGGEHQETHIARILYVPVQQRGREESEEALAVVGPGSGPEGLLHSGPVVLFALGFEDRLIKDAFGLEVLIEDRFGDVAGRGEFARGGSAKSPLGEKLDRGVDDAGSACGGWESSFDGGRH